MDSRGRVSYIRGVAPEGWRETEDALWKCFVEEAPNMLSFVEQTTPLRFSLTDQPDAFPEIRGGMQRGRMVSPGAIRRSLAGPYTAAIRPPSLSHLFTYQEALALDPSRHPLKAGLRKLPLVALRWLTGARGMGTALVVGLLKGCLDNDCRVRLGVRAVEPVLVGGRVVGLIVEQNGQRRRIFARRGVVLASGGFEWDKELLAKHFPGPIDLLGSPPGNDGDAHKIASQAGAILVHMDQANVTGGIPIRPDMLPFGISHFFHREANAIIVDRNGERFTNEYRFNLGAVIDERDPITNSPLHLPAWLISDADFLRGSPIIRYFSARNPGWVVQEDSIAQLANATSLPQDTLQRTIARFNEFCRDGVDVDFHREDPGPHGIVIGGGKAVRLKPIHRKPFVAIRFNRTIVSTKGGPRTDAAGRVLRSDGSVIGGLYCAGVAMGNPFGTWAVGPGTTLGPNMTWGYICANSIALSSP
ncbi:MAG: FAD-binding protein [Rhizobiaceae bacterium]|nr:FAD-binding protein [Rhizobiaceae bacterium]